MARLGPFEVSPALGLAVSGGADSMALALLARDWAVRQGGRVLALVVDHGLRPESEEEAALTVTRLAAQRIPARLLRLANLSRGPALAERARVARYEALTEACREAGLLHLLLGHHAADQAETLAMRALRGSASAGLAGMAALRETPSVRLLRPLLCVSPARLRTFLTRQGVDWVQDPSNQDLRALRPRLRHRMAPPDQDLLKAAALAGCQRARDETKLAAILAERTTLRPEGFAVLTPGRILPDALGALLRTIAGTAYPFPPAQLANLAREPKAATLGGARIMPMRAKLLVLREEAAIAEAQAARTGIVWDNRFRILTGPVPARATIGRLGDAAARFRRASPLPSAVLRTMPAFWVDGEPVAVPHLQRGPVRVLFVPPWALGGPDFVSATANDCNFRRLDEP
jgi:tRNA(Ile)-lysidine synthase